MTPNKLPPLPDDSALVAYPVPVHEALRIESALAHNSAMNPGALATRLNALADQLVNEKVEALRQSQSLPAGAVDEGSVVVPKVLTPEMMKAIQRSTEVGAYICDNWSGAYNVLHELWHQAINAAPKQALQADAREKGEACRHDVFDSCEQCYVEPGSATAAAGKVNGYLFRQRAVEVIVDGEIPEWMSRQPGIRVTITPEGATQPAQASDADDIERLRVLSDAASQDWRGRKNGVIVGGPFHEYTNGSAQSQIAMFTCPVSDSDVADRQQSNADFALACVTYVRATLATSSQETASE